MALRKLMAKKKLDEKRKSLTELEKRLGTVDERSTELDTREAEAEVALEELTEESTEEEKKAVEDEADDIESARDEIAKEIEALQSEKSELEASISELEKELAEEDSPEETEKPAEPEERGGNPMPRLETRNQSIERLNIPEVRSFYANLAQAAKEKRALTGGELSIPEVVVDVIISKMGDYAKVKPLVNTVQLNGTGRVLLDGAIPEGIWVECCDPLEELALSITQIQIDCYKVGGFVLVCNALIEDSFIDLANYVENKIAQAIAKAVDKAILVGTGSTDSQPAGIIPAVTNTATPADLAGLMGAVAMIDEGEQDLGEITAVMKRATYYQWIQPGTLLPSAAGELVLQNADGARLPDGTRVVFSQYMPANQVLIGDFKAGYILGERKGITLSLSEHVKFIEDQTAFKGIARYDGRPVDPKFFVLATMTATP